MFEGDIRHSDILILMIDHVFVITVSTLSNSILVVIDYNMNLTEKSYKTLKNIKAEVDSELMTCRSVVGA